VDTALKTANSGYLTRRLIDVGQDILIRERLFNESFLLLSINEHEPKTSELVYDKIWDVS
jgi:DNA-directed RNA polymerase subunit beta'